ncbi:MAG TPA: AAA family ATPase, partial [Myxococcota bacterium]|nr:AAA family ATPase [Myxococcota bacterium]
MEALDRLGEVIRRASAGLVERRALAELIVLAAVAGEHALVVGPPGTAKSLVLHRVGALLDARVFEYLLGRFTEPSELFGPIDLRQLQEGRYATVTAGMLPEAELVFLDEVFRGSSAILNALLTLLNERTLRRGAETWRCPLRVAVGATNDLPDDPALAAFADRFLVRVFVGPVSDARVEELLAAIDAPASAQPAASLADLDAAAAAASRSARDAA